MIEYSTKFCQSRKTRLWICIMLCLHSCWWQKISRWFIMYWCFFGKHATVTSRLSLFGACVYRFGLPWWKSNLTPMLFMSPSFTPCPTLVEDDPKLLDDGGEIPKSQGRGWRFDSRLWDLLSTWQNSLPGGQLPQVLWRWPVGLSSKKERKKSNCPNTH